MTGPDRACFAEIPACQKRANKSEAAARENEQIEHETRRERLKSALLDN